MGVKTQQPTLDGLDVPPLPATRRVSVKRHTRTIKVTAEQAAADLYAEPIARGRAARDAGTAKVIAKLTPEERETMRNIVKAVADMLAEFTIEDVETKLPPALRARLDDIPNARGAVMLGAAKAGLIVNTMRVKQSTNVKSRGSKIARWRKA